MKTGESSSSAAAAATDETVEFDVTGSFSANIRPKLKLSATAGDVKAKIMADYHIAAERQTLQLGEVVMDDDSRTLRSYGMAAGKSLQLKVKPIGKAITVTLNSGIGPPKDVIRLTCYESSQVYYLKKAYLSAVGLNLPVSFFNNGAQLFDVNFPLSHYLVTDGTSLTVHFCA